MQDNDPLLRELDFGSVDAESEEELAERFVYTEGFSSIADKKTLIILGPKGSGKSALFKLFTEYPEETRELLREDFPDDTHVVKATGGKDVKTLDNRSLRELKKQDDFSYEEFWEIYIGLKIASELGESGYSSGGELGNVLKALGEQPDWRIIPLFKGFWETFVGQSPSSGSISYGNFSLEFKNDENLDISRLLEEEQKLLEKHGETIWLLFDRIDELQSKDPDERKRLLEALFRTQLDFIERFDNIRLKIFLRTDIWTNLNFVNKDHVIDKRIELEWNDTQLMKMINKRMVQSDAINDFISKNMDSHIEPGEIEKYDRKSQEMIFYSVFEDQVYPGTRQADLFDWMVERIKDGHGGKYPRELITFCDEARREELKEGKGAGNRLIGGYSVRDAYYTVSQQRVDNYLSEFPGLQEHFDLFDDRNTAEYTHSELVDMFDDLEPNGKTAIDRMVDIGFFESKRDDDEKIYEIPRLYRDGIGLVIRGKP